MRNLRIINLLLGYLPISLMLAASVVADAGLVGRLPANGNYQAVYDASLNITWSGDGNLFTTMAAGNPNLVSQIVAAVPIIIDALGQYNVTAADFRPSDGNMTWYGAQAFAAYLNSINYLGSSHWMLPSTLQPDPSCGYNGNTPGQSFGCTGSQMGELFYNELGGVAGSDIATTHNASFSLFHNIGQNYLWSSTENPVNANGADNFLFGNGGQGGGDKHPISGMAWPVHPGDSPYVICALYDPTKAVHSGAVIPIKLYLCDSSGNDLSDPSVVVHATSVSVVSANAPGVLESPGNANPDFDFRYDSTLGPTGGYIFNLKTDGMHGTYSLNFTAGADPTTHSTQFEVR